MEKTNEPVMSRPIPLEGVPNCRDLGGIPAAGNKRIKSGLLFRSADLHRATDQDIYTLEKLGVRNDVDLRTEMELLASPDRILDSWHLDHLPVFTEKGLEAGTGSALKALETFYSDTEQLMVDLYPRMLLEPRGIETWKKFFALLLSSPGGVLYHCTEGKDRTGIASVLIEAALGVDEQDILDDYLQTNWYVTGLIENEEKKDGRIPFIGRQLDRDMEWFLKAEPQYLEAARKAAEPFGGWKGYLKEKIGLSDADFEKLGQLYLEGDGE